MTKRTYTTSDGTITTDLDCLEDTLHDLTQPAYAPDQMDLTIEVGSGEFVLTLRDEVGEVIDARGTTLLGALLQLNAHAAEWLDEMDEDELIAEDMDD